MPLPQLPKTKPKTFTPKMRVTGAYLKPLARDVMDQVDPMLALRMLKTELLKRMRKALTQETFSKAAKKALAQALTIKIGNSSLIIVAKHPAWKPLVEGQKKGQMSWLVRAKSPIPIITDTGKLIFRTATAKSLANGKWIHPGRPKSGFYERAREQAREFVRTKLAGQIRRQMTQAFK